MTVSLPLESSLVCGSPQNTVSVDWLLQTLLQEQQTTAVGKFSQWHAEETEPTQARYYRDLIPLSQPQYGEQYSFEVDLDACSGCKACVVACHNLNGLEDQEVWRTVGLLHGGSNELPVLQHVTTACHHCLEPACLHGCPVNAYEKDPITGIVVHLDDQCIGCQYCILKCPYDAPRYSRKKGIVRKCDMCRQRLAVDEAPACVQACPSRAIRIVLINKLDAAEHAEANMFLPGAPEPGYTLPTTVYKTRKPLPTNLLPADYFSSVRQHAHGALVMMLVLTQMSVGAFWVDQILAQFVSSSAERQQTVDRWWHLGGVWSLGLLGLAASVFHLGRPWLAYRAVIGWRTSWLSREVLAFGFFAFAASAYAFIHALDAFGIPDLKGWEKMASIATSIGGLAGVFCSTMIYASTRRVLWHPAYTGLKFLLTALMLGIPLVLLFQLVTTAWVTNTPLQQLLERTVVPLSSGMLVCTMLKLLAEAGIFFCLRARTFTPLKRTALLMSGELSRVTLHRFLWGTVGGVAAPMGIILIDPSTASYIPVTLSVLAMFVMSLVGETLERYLFFAAVVAPRMPGALTT